MAKVRRAPPEITRRLPHRRPTRRQATLYQKKENLPDLAHITGATLDPTVVKELKILAAGKALDYIADNMVIGIGTGSTVNEMIPFLSDIADSIDGVVSSSSHTTTILKKHGITPYPIESVSKIHLYIDGADQINLNFEMIKGGGGALTGEKILAGMADRFICIADTTKLVQEFSSSLPIEVIPLAAPLVRSRLAAMGAKATVIPDYKTEYGNLIVMVRGLDYSNPLRLEERLNNIEGVVTNGIFATHAADTLLLGTKNGVFEYSKITGASIDKEAIKLELSE